MTDSTRNLRMGASALLLILALIITGNVKSEIFDHSYQTYGLLLSTHMSDGLIDYAAIKADRATLDATIAEFSAVSKAEFDRFTRQEQIAYLINAYNLYTIVSIVDSYPISGIKKIKGVWNKNRFRIAGEQLTLDNVEHDLLRKTYREPRIHVAVVCASISCPELWDQPFTADSLDNQLELRSATFATDITRIRVDTSSGTVYLSKILKWYGSDFESYVENSAYKGVGKKMAGVLGFLSPYWPKEVQEALQNRKLRTKYLDYNWGLNEPTSSSGG